MITDQSQWNGPLVARDGTRMVGAKVALGPDQEGDYLVIFAENLTDRTGRPTDRAWFKSDGTAFFQGDRNITVSPAPFEQEHPAMSNEAVTDTSKVLPVEGEPKHIFLQPNCCAEHSYEGRQWCEDAVWEKCECEHPLPIVKYVRADLATRPLPVSREQIAEILAPDAFRDGDVGGVRAADRRRALGLADRILTISPAAEGAGDICDGGGDASDETAGRIEALTAQLAERDAEIKALREEVARLREREEKLREALWLFREFAARNATQWERGANHHHPIYFMIAKQLGDARNPMMDRHFAFIQPENRAALESTDQ